MDSEHAVIIDEVIFIPKDAFSFEGFQDWCFSDVFPETGRIDYLAGTIELELNDVGTGQRICSPTMPSGEKSEPGFIYS